MKQTKFTKAALDLMNMLEPRFQAVLVRTACAMLHDPKKSRLVRRSRLLTGTQARDYRNWSRRCARRRNRDFKPKIGTAATHKTGGNI